jgi:hypothetical protein
LLDEGINGGGQFQDTQFPPLLKDSSHFFGGWSQDQIDTLNWRHISELPLFNQYKSISTKVFGEEIKSSDIVKGQFYNPYFLSYISALAEAPGRIEKLFEILF